MPGQGIPTDPWSFFATIFRGFLTPAHPVDPDSQRAIDAGIGQGGSCPPGYILRRGRSTVQCVPDPNYSPPVLTPPALPTPDQPIPATPVAPQAPQPPTAPPDATPPAPNAPGPVIVPPVQAFSPYPGSGNPGSATHRDKSGRRRRGGRPSPDQRIYKRSLLTRKPIGFGGLLGVFNAALIGFQIGTKIYPYIEPALSRIVDSAFGKAPHTGKYTNADRRSQPRGHGAIGVRRLPLIGVVTIDTGQLAAPGDMPNPRPRRVAAPTKAPVPFSTRPFGAPGGLPSPFPARPGPARAPGRVTRATPVRVTAPTRPGVATDVLQFLLRIPRSRPSRVPTPGRTPDVAPGMGPSPTPGFTPTPGPGPVPLPQPSPKPIPPDPLTLVATPGVPYRPQEPGRGRCRSSGKKRKKRDPRQVCWRGTYTETPLGLRKSRKEQVTCQ